MFFRSHHCAAERTFKVHTYVATLIFKWGSEVDNQFFSVADTWEWHFAVEYCCEAILLEVCPCSIIVEHMATWCLLERNLGWESKLRSTLSVVEQAHTCELHSLLLHLLSEEDSLTSWIWILKEERITPAHVVVNVEVEPSCSILWLNSNFDWISDSVVSRICIWCEFYSCWDVNLTFCAWEPLYRHLNSLVWCHGNTLALAQHYVCIGIENHYLIVVYISRTLVSHIHSECLWHVAVHLIWTC